MTLPVAPCPDCQGTGCLDRHRNQWTVCSRCGGSGVVATAEHTVYGIAIEACTEADAKLIALQTYGQGILILHAHGITCQRDGDVTRSTPIVGYTDYEDKEPDPNLTPEENMNMANWYIDDACWTFYHD